MARLLTWSQIFFFFSGATGLIYQTLWTRRLTLVFGHTVLAVSTAVTIFMGGLALGSLLAGRWADKRSDSPSGFLADYGYLEGFIGLWALVSLPLLSGVDKLYVTLAAGGVSGWPLHSACFVGAAVVLLAPTTAMGATIPILTRLLVHRSPELGQILSRLYGFNTLGALLGAGLGGFVLLSTMGLALSMVAAALTNLTIAAGAVFISRTAEPLETAAVGKGPQSQVSAQAALILVTFGLAGLSSMIYQVAWNRALALSFGSSTYAFSTILIAFLGGLGMGSLFYSTIMKGQCPRVEQLGWLYIAIGFLGCLTIAALGELPGVFLSFSNYVGSSFVRALSVQVALAVTVLAGPTFFMGFGFPLATAVYVTGIDYLGRRVGEVYCTNTLGCIVGAYLTGFVLVPELGAQRSLQLASGIYLICGLVVVWSRTTARRWLPLAAGGFGLLVTLALPRWDSGLMESGVAIYASRYAGMDEPERRLHFLPPAFVEEGLSCNVSLSYTGSFFEILSLRVNGKADASSSVGDLRTQYLLGYLPTLLHPAPERVAVIGLGAGYTLEAVAQCPGVERLDCVELEPAVAAFAEIWKPYNGRVLEDPRVRLHITDGRTYVLGLKHKLDVLISEPSNPWIAGIGNLFTVDFYQTAISRLQPDGIMCQWLNLYAVSPDDIGMVLHSFYQVFPYGQIWQSSTGDLLLLGSAQPLEVKRGRIAEAWRNSPSLQRNLFRIGISQPEMFYGHYLGSRETVLQQVAGARLNSDDLPLLEYSAPLSLYHTDWRRNAELVESMADFEMHLDVWAALGAASLGHQDRAEKILEIEQRNNLESQIVRAGVLAHREPQRAKQIYRDCLEANPRASRAAIAWADLESQEAQFERAATLYAAALVDPPPGALGELNLRVGECLWRGGRLAESAPYFKAATEAMPYHSLAFAHLGHALLRGGQTEPAAEAFDRSLELNAHEPYARLGRVYLHSDLENMKACEEALLAFLRYSPGQVQEWLRLARLYRTTGRNDLSRKAARRALEFDPGNQAARALLN